jgi:hypothetical protein
MHWFHSSHFADCEPRSKGLKIIYQIDKSFSKSMECRLMHFNHFRLSKKQITGVLVFLFTVFGIQSSYADYYPSGIQQNVSEQTLRNNGWALFYEQTYGTVIGTTATPLIPSGQYVILAGKAVGSSNILLAAAAPTAQVFTETDLNTPQLLNGTYWYNTPNKSTGFAPTATINQTTADAYDVSNPLRLSWHLDTIGGWRLGEINSFNIANGNIELNNGAGGAAYLKQVWTWNGQSTSGRPSTNLTFAQSLYASDTLSDSNGQLRATVDQIMNKYGSLIK